MGNLREGPDFIINFPFTIASYARLKIQSCLQRIRTAEQEYKPIFVRIKLLMMLFVYFAFIKQK